MRYCILSTTGDFTQHFIPSRTEDSLPALSRVSAHVSLRVFVLVCILARTHAIKTAIRLRYGAVPRLSNGRYRAKFFPGEANRIKVGEVPRVGENEA